jgi:hypothetical protein
MLQTIVPEGEHDEHTLSPILPAELNDTVAVNDATHQEKTHDEPAGERAVIDATAVEQAVPFEAAGREDADDRAVSDQTFGEPAIAEFGAAETVTDADDIAEFEDDAEFEDAGDYSGYAADDVIGGIRPIHPLFLGVLAAKIQHYLAQSTLLSVALVEDLTSAASYQELVRAQIGFVHAQTTLFGDECKWLSRACNGLIAQRTTDVA